MTQHANDRGIPAQNWPKAAPPTLFGQTDISNQPLQSLFSDRLARIITAR